jgi:arylsulfatase A-like enzyme
MTRPLAALAVALGVSACQKATPHPSEGATSATPPTPAAVTSASAGPAALEESGVSGGTPAPRKLPDGPLNVLLLSIDCLRADMPWAGYPKPIAPNLTKLAEESVQYTRAYSVSSYTAKSVGAILSGRYPSSLYRSGWFFTDYAKSNLFFPEVLHEHGVETMGVHAHLYFGKGKQLDQGFDIWEVVPGIRFDATTDKNVTSDKVTDIGIKLLGDAKNTSKPFFAWLHYVDPHDEYVKHKESPDFGKDNRGRYDSEVFFTDLHIGRLLEFVQKQPYWDKTVVIVTADHGEAFGEHGVYKHAFWLWDVLTRVPLLVHAPGAAPKKIDERRSHVDLAPTILDFTGVKDKPASFVGKSLVSEVYGADQPDNREPMILDLPEDSHNPEIRGIVLGDLKFLQYAKVRSELYDIAADPGELKDISKSRPEDLVKMKAEFEKAWSTISRVESYGGMKLREGRTANGPMGPTP